MFILNYLMFLQLFHYFYQISLFGFLNFLENDQLKVYTFACQNNYYQLKNKFKIIFLYLVVIVYLIFLLLIDNNRQIQNNFANIHYQLFLRFNNNLLIIISSTNPISLIIPLNFHKSHELFYNYNNFNTYYQVYLNNLF